MTAFTNQLNTSVLNDLQYPQQEFLQIHFDEIFEEFSTHTIRTKQQMQINGAVLGPNIFIPVSFYVNGNSLESLKGRLLKASVTEQKILKIVGLVETP